MAKEVAKEADSRIVDNAGKAVKGNSAGVETQRSITAGGRTVCTLVRQRDGTPPLGGNSVKDHVNKEAR